MTPAVCYNLSILTLMLSSKKKEKQKKTKKPGHGSRVPCDLDLVRIGSEGHTFLPCPPDLPAAFQTPGSDSAVALTVLQLQDMLYLPLQVYQLYKYSQR